MAVGPIFVDKYFEQRGGRYRIYDLACRECGKILGRYQKDGSFGSLRRLYIDRIAPALKMNKKPAEIWQCSCGERLGALVMYDKEPRLAYQLFVDAVIVTSSSFLIKMLNKLGKY